MSKILVRGLDISAAGCNNLIQSQWRKALVWIRSLMALENALNYHFLLKQDIILPISSLQIHLMLSLWKDKDASGIAPHPWNGFPQFAIPDASLDSPVPHHLSRLMNI